MTDTIAARLAARGITIPDAPAPAANYVPALVHGDHLFISGQLPMIAGNMEVVGKLGREVSIVEGQRAAEIIAINLLAQAQAALGDLERIAQVLRITAFVNSAPEFADQPQVVNGCSNLLAEILGARGKHTRSAVGVANLPFNAAVECDAIFAIKA